ncbi:non-homologous end-joining DNA ligase [Alkalihalobacillus macyae]|uniref:non-homologous end-joining DNA ligase n=1 Tax=Guptibacillus hwajinpoensis TaxID=208199 RepID=UPI00273B874D|nr:non-homologous end-joining DNA ligase [Alkalihalobacillus macyae]MDP4550743.1 non-homologous end-joining DNA ligase [Alkalihalobacillus macyae]
MSKPLLPMIPKLSHSFPTNDDWIYEVKYDGYRSILAWDGKTLSLTSRNGHDLNSRFAPLHDNLALLLLNHQIDPCILDGEICMLSNTYRADFESLHKRKEKNLSFICFDMLKKGEVSLIASPLVTRKDELRRLFKNIPNQDILIEISFSPSAQDLFELVKNHNGEGVVCKKVHSVYREGKRTSNWLKVKNWKSAYVFLYAYEKANGYFYTGVKREGEIYEVGHFSHGLSSEEREALLQVIKRNKIKEANGFIYVQPAIVLELVFIDLYNETLRQPRFKQFCFQTSLEVCTWDTIQSSLMT